MFGCGRYFGFFTKRTRPAYRVAVVRQNFERSTEFWEVGGAVSGWGRILGVGRWRLGGAQISALGAGIYAEYSFSAVFFSFGGGPPYTTVPKKGRCQEEPRKIKSTKTSMFFYQKSILSTSKSESPRKNCVRYNMAKRSIFFGRVV